MSKVKAVEHLCKVKSFKMLTPSVFEVVFDTEQPLKFIAGQFVSVIIPGAGPKGRDLRRAYSIASPPGAHVNRTLCEIGGGGAGYSVFVSAKTRRHFSGDGSLW